jgi:hypothetical protein
MHSGHHAWIACCAVGWLGCFQCITLGLVLPFQRPNLSPFGLMKQTFALELACFGQHALHVNTAARTFVVHLPHTQFTSHEVLLTWSNPPLHRCTTRLTPLQGCHADWQRCVDGSLLAKREHGRSGALRWSSERNGQRDGAHSSRRGAGRRGVHPTRPLAMFEPPDSARMWNHCLSGSHTHTHNSMHAKPSLELRELSVCSRVTFLCQWSVWARGCPLVLVMFA